jgi:hypothetical protein
MSVEDMEHPNDEPTTEEEALAQGYQPTELPDMEATLASIPEEQKTFLLVVFLLLQQHKKFHELVEEHFEIRKAIDDEKKTVDIQVHLKPEKPRARVSGAQLMKIHSVLMKYGLQDKSSKALKEITDVLKDKDDVPSILTASEGDMNAAIAETRRQEELKAKL